MPRRGRRADRDGPRAATTESGAAKEERTAAFTKTKMCKFHILGVCTRGQSCQFAHDRCELQPLPDLYRTKLCKTLISTGLCSDPACKYAHSKEELRPLPPGVMLHRDGAERSGGEDGGDSRAARPASRGAAPPPPPPPQPQFAAPQPPLQMPWQSQLLPPHTGEFGEPHDQALQHAASGLTAHAVAQAHAAAAARYAEAAHLQALHSSLGAAHYGLHGAAPHLLTQAAAGHFHLDAAAHPLLHGAGLLDSLPGSGLTQNLVVKNTFLDIPDERPLISPSRLRPVMSAAARLDTLGCEDAEEALLEDLPRAMPGEPVQINPNSLRSMSSNSISSLARLAGDDGDDELLAQPGLGATAAAAEAGEPARISAGGLRPISSTASRLDALAEEAPVSSAAPSPRTPQSVPAMRPGIGCRADSRDATYGFGATCGTSLLEETPFPGDWRPMELTGSRLAAAAWTRQPAGREVLDWGSLTVKNTFLAAEEPLPALREVQTASGRLDLMAQE